MKGCAIKPGKELKDRRVKITAIVILFIYCFLFLLANSPFHIKLDYRNSAHKSSLPFIPFAGQNCPLHAFLGLIFCIAALSAFLIIWVFWSPLISSQSLRILHSQKICNYQSQAPPVSL